MATSGPILRPWLADLPPYVPGVPAEHASGRLASNEAANPPAWLTRTAPAVPLEAVHRYPDPTARDLRDKLADHHGVQAEEVLVGNGSDELIQLLIQAYAAFTGSVTVAHPGYAMYRLCATRLGARVADVPLTAGWTHDLAAMARQEVDIAFVGNPHNPTGTVVDPEDLLRFLEARTARLVVLDEAYIDFVSSRLRLPTTRIAVRDPGVVVLRTFSKAYALAGLRVGYLIGHKSIIRTLTRLRLPFSVNSAAQHYAALSLDHARAVSDDIRDTVTRRHELVDLLGGAGLTVLPSAANFVLAITTNSETLTHHLRNHGITVRPGKDLGVPDAVRITVPSAVGLQRLREALSGYQALEG